MNVKDFTSRLKYLGTAYNHKFSEEEAEVWYDFLKNYSIDVFNKAIKSCIENNKFMPKVADIKEYCEKEREVVKFDILERMVEDGYFRHPTEYEKAVSWLERNIIPEWFKKDMQKYDQKLLGKKEMIE